MSSGAMAWYKRRAVSMGTPIDSTTAMRHFKRRLPAEETSSIVSTLRSKNMNMPVRGGANLASTNMKLPFQQVVAMVVEALTTATRKVLPPVVAVVRAIVGFYRILPKDALIAQVGLVYCFWGGCFPTLFAAIQAARQCGVQPMMRAISDLTDQAVVAVEATKDKISYNAQTPREIFIQTTMVVMQSVDPVKVIHKVEVPRRSTPYSSHDGRAYTLMCSLCKIHRLIMHVVPCTPHGLVYQRCWNTNLRAR